MKKAHRMAGFEMFRERSARPAQNTRNLGSVKYLVWAWLQQGDMVNINLST
jgi:hypothetical protein